VAGHSHVKLPAEEPGDFVAKTARLALMAKVAAAAGLLVTLVIGLIAHDGFRTFYFTYLTGFGFWLALCLASLFFVLIHHVARAGWSVNVRRVAENMAAQLPVLAILSLPIFVSVLMQRGDLYRWALPESTLVAHTTEAAKAEPKNAATGGEEGLASEAGNQQINPEVGFKVTDEEMKHEADPGPGNRHLDELTMKKRAWLSPLSFSFRLVFYFAIWSIIAIYYLRHSVQQDADGDYRHTVLLQRWSALSLVVFGLTLTAGAFDLFMSLDPHWFSTMFGVYYFATGVVCFFAALIVTVALLQRAGYLLEAVNREHYHDMGKYLFAFTFFWGYVTFSQYMLLWYSSIPEEVTWPARHGMHTGHELPNMGDQWHVVSILVLFGCFLFPFPGLLSRHVKRNKKSLLFWAVWVLVFQFVNIIWIVLPEMRLGLKVVPILGAIAAMIGIGGVLVAGWLRTAARAKLRPVNDPRVFESAAFVNV
jgi:hypothetical protein